MEYFFVKVTIFSIILLLVCSKKLNFRLLKVECEMIDSSAGNITCIIRNTNSSENSADIDIYLYRPLNEITAHMALWKKLNNNYILTPINLTINACRFRSKDERIPFHASLIIKWVRTFSNVNHTCPYEGHMFVRNLKPSNFRMVIPDGEYRMQVTLYDKSLENPVLIMRGFGKKF